MLTLDMTTLDTEEDEREDTLPEVPALPPAPRPGPELQLVPVQDSEPPRARRILAVGARLRGCAPILLALSSGCGQEAGVALQLLLALAGAVVFVVIS